jgi:benzylsuccinate CoA-transferase BbsF subunit
MAVVRRLASKCDVILENYRPGVLDRLGLPYETLRADRPDTIVVKMPGLGSTGPARGYGTWGALLNAYTGLTWLWNHPGTTTPVGYQGVFADYVGAVFAPMVVVSALIGRNTTGQGCLIDLAQSEAVAFAALPVSLLEVSVNRSDPEQVGNRSRGPEIQGVYPCQGDDRWCAIRIEDDAQWLAALEVMGRADLASEPRFASIEARRAHHDEIDAVISAWSSGVEAPAVMEALQARGVPAGVVASGKDLLEDPQLNRVGFIRRFDQPGIGEMVIPGLPLEIRPPLVDEPGPASLLGADTQAILKGVVGLDDDEYAHLEQAGVLA